jgi:hypothetical protein
MCTNETRVCDWRGPVRGILLRYVITTVADDVYELHSGCKYKLCTCIISILYTELRAGGWANVE